MGSTLKNTGLVSLGVIAGVAVSMQFSALAQKPVEQGMPLDELRQLADVYGLIKTDYVEAVGDKKLLTDAIAGMVASLDPHSAYLDKKAYAELREGTEGRFVGLGIEIVQSDDGYIKIVAPIEDSPAWRAGIKAGDLVTRIDGLAIQGLGIDEAIKKMRGAPRTKVSLTVVRKDVAAPLEFAIAREEIVQKSVKAKIVEPGYGWLRVSQFQEPTVDDLAARIVALYKQEPNLKGLVLDLRNDPGGVLQGAIGVSAAFLPKDAEIVSTNGQLPGSKQSFYGRPEFYSLRGDGDALARLPAAVKNVPLVVLVNTGSASASEIVAGALQDYKRAIIMGSQTFGKGSVQTIRPLSQRHRGQADHGALLHAGRPLDPGQGHRARFPGRRKRRRRRPEWLAHARSRPRKAPVQRPRQGRRPRGAARRSRRRTAADRHGAQTQAARIRQRRRLPAEAGAEPPQGTAAATVETRQSRARAPGPDGARALTACTGQTPVFLLGVCQVPLTSSRHSRAGGNPSASAHRWHGFRLRGNDDSRLAAFESDPGGVDACKPRCALFPRQQNVAAFTPIANAHV